MHPWTLLSTLVSFHSGPRWYFLWSSLWDIDLFLLLEVTWCGSACLEAATLFRSPGRQCIFRSQMFSAWVWAACLLCSLSFSLESTMSTPSSFLTCCQIFVGAVLNLLLFLLDGKYFIKFVKFHFLRNHRIFTYWFILLQHLHIWCIFKCVFHLTKF